jgi:pantoate--beta-alanine ligase
MKIITTVKELRAWSREARKSGLQASPKVGLVPTMGALHEGHLSLVRAAKAACGAVAASIFVNPTQFGSNEDFSKYPRTFEADCALLQAEGVDVVFAPTPEEMYRPGATTFVEVEGLSDRLDGASRPGHFRGVATVVAKLFLAAEPDQAFFGQKDAAQVAVLRQMTADLGLPVEIVVCPIVREPDGLAMSSRNRYLSAEERRQALVLSQAIHQAQHLWHRGETNASRLIETAQSVIATEPSVRIDYIAAVDWQTLLPVTIVKDGTLFALAAYIGNTRLIDNFIARKPESMD